jgi:beta-glucosidase
VPPAEELQTLTHGMERRTEALGASNSYAAGVLPGVPLIVTENGIATADDQAWSRSTGRPSSGRRSRAWRGSAR